MVEYKCLLCEKTIARKLIERKTRCPFCNSKIIRKAQISVLDPIKAR